MQTKENKKTDYTEACNTVNNLMDKMFNLFGCGDATKYHINEEDVREALGDIVSNDTKDECVGCTCKDECCTEKTINDKDQALIDEYKEKYGLDMTDFMNVVNDLIHNYKPDSTDNLKVTLEHVECDDESDSCTECDGDCDYCDHIDDCISELDDCREMEYSNPSKVFCAGVMDRLKSEIAAEKEGNNTDEIDAYTYEQMMYDINSILDDPESCDYEFIIEEGKPDVVKVTYHIGYQNKTEYQTIVNYARQLDSDLKKMYGFSNVYISSDNHEDDQYITFYIFMEI